MKAMSEASAVRFVQPKGKLDSKPSVPLCWLSSEPATAPMAAAAAIVTGTVWRWANGGCGNDGGARACPVCAPATTRMVARRLRDGRQRLDMTITIMILAMATPAHAATVR